MKRIIAIILTVLIFLSLLSGCESKASYEKYQDTFFDTFDTVITVVAYTETEEEFESYMGKIKDRFMELHKLYDRYNDYEGINNIKTINDNAGIEPVEVKQEIIDLILFSKEWYEKAGKKTNIAFGPVVEIWTEYGERAEADPEDAELPPMEILEEANEYTDIEKVIVDEENNTVYLEEENMSLDVGGVAKGYATELVAVEMEEEGLNSTLINAGGNIRGVGKPLDGKRERWGVGLQNPDEDLFDTGNVLDTVFVNNESVVSSGDYERYYMYDDMRIHHIIDPKTLMPGDYYRAVTIVTSHSGLADFLSTSVFLLPFDESLELVESLEDVEALWITKDGDIKSTDGMKKIMRSEGASGGDKK
ncbi:MAG TPA: FAD:protein FMN transferase [Tissierellaceae bacterium]|nr:FAD:protein FMN transferase [Tissierellaceae bacterium]